MLINSMEIHLETKVQNKSMTLTIFCTTFSSSWQWTDITTIRPLSGSQQHTSHILGREQQSVEPWLSLCLFLMIFTPGRSRPWLPLLGDGRLNPMAHGFSISPVVTSRQVDSLLAKPAFPLHPPCPSWAQSRDLHTSRDSSCFFPARCGLVQLQGHEQQVRGGRRWVREAFRDSVSWRVQI